MLLFIITPVPVLHRFHDKESYRLVTTLFYHGRSEPLVTPSDTCKQRTKIVVTKVPSAAASSVVLEYAVHHHFQNVPIASFILRHYMSNQLNGLIACLPFLTKTSKREAACVLLLLF